MTTVTVMMSRRRGGVSETLEKAVNHLERFMSAVNMCGEESCRGTGPEAARLLDNVRSNKQNVQLVDTDINLHLLNYFQCWILYMTVVITMFMLDVGHEMIIFIVITFSLFR